MKIVCDKNMPYAAEAFGTLGEVFQKGGRQIAPADVCDAAALITRSTTRVNRDLLEESAVRFYGSGVIGTDHIDIPYLESRGIAWSAAPGCNAESVANYVTAALLWLGGRHGLTLHACEGAGAPRVGERSAPAAQSRGPRGSDLCRVRSDSGRCGYRHLPRAPDQVGA